MFYHNFSARGQVFRASGTVFELRAEPSITLRASGTLGQAKNRLGRAELSGSRVPDLPLVNTEHFSKFFEMVTP